MSFLSPVLALPAIVVGIITVVFVKTRPPPELASITPVTLSDGLKLLSQGLTYPEYAAQVHYYVQDTLRRIFLGRWMVILTTPQHAKQLFTDIAGFPKLSISKYRPWTLNTFFYGRSVIGDSGEIWERHRRTVSPAFQRLFPTSVFRSTVLEMLEHWDMPPSGKELNVQEWMSRLTFDVLGHTLLDLDFGTLANKDAKMITLFSQVNKAAADTFYVTFEWLDRRWNPWRLAAFQAADAMNALLDDIINQRRAQVQERLEKEATGQVEEQKQREKDLLTLMLETLYTGEEGHALSHDEIRWNMAVFLIAGHDTTAVALATQLYYMATHPDVQRKAREEVLQLLPTDESITPKTKLPYLEAVMHESMRMSTPVTLLPMRMTSRPCVVSSNDGHVTLPTETMCALDMTSVHYNPTVWKNADQFQPDRWLTPEAAEIKRQGFYSFGAGPRICMGMQFSLLEQRVVLSMLLRRYEWTLPADSIHRDSLQMKGFIISKPVDLGIVFTPLA
jgi:cytochrome P450